MKLQEGDIVEIDFFPKNLFVIKYIREVQAPSGTEIQIIYEPLIEGKFKGTGCDIDPNRFKLIQRP